MSLIYKMNRKAYKGWNYRDYMVSKQGKPQSNRKGRRRNARERERECSMECNGDGLKVKYTPVALLFLPPRVRMSVCV